MQEAKNQDGGKSTRSRNRTAKTRVRPQREHRNKTATPAASPQNTPPASGPNNMPAPTPYRTKAAQPAAPSQDKATESAAPQTIAPTLKTLPERIKEYENNSWGWPALHYAIDMKDEEAAQHFINANPEQAKLLTPSLPIMKFHDGGKASKDYDHKIWDEQGISAVELAARQNLSSTLVSKLIDLGAEFKQGRKDYFGMIRDDWESLTGYAKGRNKLSSAFGRSEEYQLFTPIYWAIKNKNKELEDLLISKGSNLNDLAYAKRATERATCRIVEEQYTAQQLQKKIGS
jgi:ankyrin repeat protein